MPCAGGAVRSLILPRLKSPSWMVGEMQKTAGAGWLPHSSIFVMPSSITGMMKKTEAM
jgi:hypothetical protein